MQHGFDEYLGLPYSNDQWPKGYRGPEKTSWQDTMPPLPLIEDNKPKMYIRNMDQMNTLTTRYTQRAVRFINDHKRQPFFLYFAHSMPHVLLAVSDKFKGKSKQGLYGDVMMEIDWSVGQVMKTLKENGLEDNTLIIFTSDNGPWLNFGNHAGSSGGLAGGKQTTWEGGQRELSIMRWPRVIPAGTVNNKLACTIGILPTLAKITGLIFFLCSRPKKMPNPEITCIIPIIKMIWKRYARANGSWCWPTVTKLMKKRSRVRTEARVPFTLLPQV